MIHAIELHTFRVDIEELNDPYKEDHCGQAQGKQD